MLTYHCCATCKSFTVEKTAASTIYKCSRLGFETKTNYQFNCWVPTEKVKALMKKREDAH